MGTVRLVAAARAKLNPASPTSGKLQNAAGGVQRTTAMLVEHAKSYAEQTEEVEVEDENLGAVARMRKKQEELNELQRLEKQLQMAESEYFALNKKRYQG